MAERLYTGLVNKQLCGNREDAKLLEREARIKVGYLFDRMLPGQKFTSGSWSLGDGRSITAFVWNDVNGKRATVRLTGISSDKDFLPHRDFYMEHGWLTWKYIEQDFYESLLYPNSDFRNYVLSTPDATDMESRPETPPCDRRDCNKCIPHRYEKIRGRLSVYKSHTGGKTGFPVWCEAPEDFVLTDGGYNWANKKETWDPLYEILYNVQGGINLQYYLSFFERGELDTGELKLLRQCIHGSGRSFLEFIGDLGWSISSADVGCVINNTDTAEDKNIGDYWLYQITASGCVVVKLIPDEKLVSALSPLLAAYKGDKTTFNMLKAYVIGNFKTPEYEQQIEVLSQSQLAVIYADGSAPIAHGWHGVFQQNGESPKAVSVFSRFDLGTRIYTSRYCEIAFSFADEIPSATLHVSNKETWGGTAFRVRVPIVGTLATARIDMGNDVLEREATIYCYTTPKGIVKVIKAACSNDVITSTSPVPNWPITCKSFSLSGTSTRRGGYGGWRLSGGQNVSEKHELVEFDYKETRSLSIGAGSSYTHPWSNVNPVASDRLYFSGNTCGEPLTTDERDQINAFDGPWTVTGLSWEMNESSVTKTGGENGIVLVILPTDTGVILAKHEYFDSIATYSKTFTSDEYLALLGDPALNVYMGMFSSWTTGGQGDPGASCRLEPQLNSVGYPLTISKYGEVGTLIWLGGGYTTGLGTPITYSTEKVTDRELTLYSSNNYTAKITDEIFFSLAGYADVAYAPNVATTGLGTTVYTSEAGVSRVSSNGNVPEIILDTSSIFWPIGAV